MNTIPFRVEELKQKGHLHIEQLERDFPERKIRKALSKYMGMKWVPSDEDSGFHFSHQPTIKEMERAVAWLALAASQKTLAPLTKEQKEKKQVKEEKQVILNQAEMNAAIARLPKRKKLWWRRVLGWVVHRWGLRRATQYARV